MRFHRTTLLPSLLIGLLLLTSCGGQAAETPSTTAADSKTSDAQASESQSANLFAMDTVMTLTAYGAHAQAGLDAATQEIQRLDNLFSISSADGDIAVLNAQGTNTLSDDTASLLRQALALSEDTGGLFDCTIAPVMTAWGFSTGEYHVPDDATLQDLLSRVDSSKVRLDGSTATLPENVSIDLGGIAKGFTSARIMQVFRDQGVTSGIVSLGGNVQALGHKPDGSSWRVAIQDPRDQSENFLVLEIAEQAVITSGGYQRYFEEDGKTYHHIIDPRTGYPADSGVLSMTIVSADGTLADGLSTSLFIMGPEKAAEYWRAHQDEFDAVWMTDDGSVYLTKGLENCYESLTDASVQVIS